MLGYFGPYCFMEIDTCEKVPICYTLIPFCSGFPPTSCLENPTSGLFFWFNWNLTWRIVDTWLCQNLCVKLSTQHVIDHWKIPLLGWIAVATEYLGCRNPQVRVSREVHRLCVWVYVYNRGRRHHPLHACIYTHMDHSPPAFQLSPFFNGHFFFT